MQHLKTHGGSKTISKQNPKIVNLLYFTRYKAESPSYVLSLIPYLNFQLNLNSTSSEPQP